MPLYTITDNVDDQYASDINQFSDALSGNADIGQIKAFVPLSVPPAPTVAINTTVGNLTGEYQYVVCFLTGYWHGEQGIGTLLSQGNTGYGTSSTVISPSGEQVNITIPIGPTGTVARIIGRTKANAPGNYYQLTQINDNTTTAWTDNTPDTGLGVVLTQTNTTGTKFVGDGSALTGVLTTSQLGQPGGAAAENDFAAHQADYVRQPGYAPDTGTANHIVMTLSPAPTSYVDGMGVIIKPANASTAITDINVNGLGVKNIVDSFGNPVTNFKANTIYSLKYEATSGNFIVQGKGGGGNATAPDLYSAKTASTDLGNIVGTNPYKRGVTISNKFSTSLSASGVASINPIPIQVMAIAQTNSWYGFVAWGDPISKTYICEKLGQSSNAIKIDSSGKMLGSANLTSYINYGNYMKGIIIGGYLYLINGGYSVKLKYSDLSFTTSSATDTSVTYALYDSTQGIFYVLKNTGIITLDMNLALIGTVYANTDGTATGVATDANYYYISTTNGTTYKIKKYKKSDNSLVFSTTISQQVTVMGVLSDGSIIGVSNSTSPGTLYKLSATDGSIVASIQQPCAGNIMDVAVVNDIIYTVNGSLCAYPSNLSTSYVVGGLMGTGYQIDVDNNSLYISTQVYSGNYYPCLQRYDAGITLN